MKTTTLYSWGALAVLLAALLVSPHTVGAYELADGEDASDYYITFSEKCEEKGIAVQTSFEEFETRLEQSDAASLESFVDEMVSEEADRHQEAAARIASNEAGTRGGTSAVTAALALVVAGGVTAIALTAHHFHKNREVGEVGCRGGRIARRLAMAACLVLLASALVTWCFASITLLYVDALLVCPIFIIAAAFYVTSQEPSTPRRTLVPLLGGICLLGGAYEVLALTLLVGIPGALGLWNVTFPVTEYFFLGATAAVLGALAGAVHQRRK